MVSLSPAVLLLPLLGGIGAARLGPPAPAARPVASRPASSTLTVPSGNFSITAPAGWVWHEQTIGDPQVSTSGRTFVCQSPGAAASFVVGDFAPPRNYALDTRTMDAFGSGAGRSASQHGWTLSAFRYEPSSFPLPHSFALNYRLDHPPRSRLYCHGRAVWTGHQVIVQTCGGQAAEPAAFVTFVSSLHPLGLVPPPPGRRAVLDSPIPYIVVLLLAWGMATLVNRVRPASSLNAWRFAGYGVALALVAAIALLVLHPLIQDLPIEDIASRTASLIAGAVPALLLAVVGNAVNRRRARRAREAALAAGDMSDG